jgi:antitoxin VapB
MALRIEDKETEQLAAEIASLAGESKTDAVRQSVRERRDRIKLQRGRRRRPRSKRELLHFMETEIWPLIPEEHRGKPPMTKAEREEILGIGPEGY